MSGAADRRKERSAKSRSGALSEPRKLGISLGLRYDPEDFGRLSESVARFLGTARFLVIQSVVVIIWVAVNIIYGLARYGHILARGLFDPYPFILLNLMFSTQAAYAAPLILLAQNRQEKRDRRATEHDREIAFRTQADTEFVARELASIRLALSDVVTEDQLDEALERVVGHAVEKAVERAVERALRRSPEVAPPDEG